jgi:phosphatidylserine/phosphatidylglycerophosphate/cardiolipin synthase-like enzyme
MSQIMQSIARLALEIHPDTAQGIASSISRLESVNDCGKVGSCGLSGKTLDMLHQVLDTWKKSGKESPEEVAAAIRSASTVATTVGSRQSLELVWSGPDTTMVPIRRTEQVLIEVIAKARNTFFMVCFVAYEVPSVIKAMRDAVTRGVKIKVLLETVEGKGGKISIDSVAMMQAAVPEADVYVWTPDGKMDVSGRFSGAVHAKCVVADDNVAFVTSANITKAALNTNMELGVLVKGGELPNQLAHHLRALVTIGAIVEA